MIEKSKTPKVEFANRIGISIQSFNYKYKNGNLEWEDIQKLRLPIKKEEFSKAMTKDLKERVKIG